MKQLTDKQKAQLTKLVIKLVKDTWGYQQDKRLSIAVDDETGKFHGSHWDANTSVRWEDGYTEINSRWTEFDTFQAECEEVINTAVEIANEQYEAKCRELLYKAVDKNQITDNEAFGLWDYFTPNGYGTPMPKTMVKEFIRWVQESREEEEVAA
jgi:hypothetical protein